MRFSGFDDLLSCRAHDTPDAAALRYFDGQKVCVLSYAQLYREALKRAEDLRSNEKSCLGILCSTGLHTLIDLFGAVLAGMQVVMLDDTFPVQTLSEQISCGDVDCLSGPPERCAALGECITGGIGAAAGSGRILFFTSGTTSRAKAVVLTDESLCGSAWNGSQMFPLSPEDVLLCILPLAHVFGLVCGVLWALQCGASAALGRGPRHYWDDWDLFRPTAASLVPAMAESFLKMNCFNPQLARILIGAGDCRDEVIGGIAGSGRTAAFGYGLTETSSGVAISVDGDPRALSPCPDVRIAVADDGEILIDAPTCIMQGYYKRPQESEEALRGGMLHTGDLGFLDEEGKLHVSGRREDVLVFSNGMKIYLPEYEAELSGLLGIGDLAVIKDEDRPALVCYTEMSEAEIREKLRSRSEKTQRGLQIGKIILASDPLPRTATGKLMRWKL